MPDNPPKERLSGCGGESPLLRCQHLILNPAISFPPVMQNKKLEIDISSDWGGRVIPFKRRRAINGIETANSDGIEGEGDAGGEDTTRIHNAEKCKKIFKSVINDTIYIQMRMARQATF